ncbi:MAG: hypothetical protein IKJ00_04725 [Clostridia bacterium]|nr:hypothetical protein [Clostridia bacterium]
MKRILALLFTIVMLSVSVVCPVAAQTTAPVETSLFSQTFEGTEFTTSMTTAQIATALGWTSWNADAADLKIVETVWVREATGALGLADVRDNAAFKAAAAWDEGSNHEHANCNHRIIDVALLKEHIDKAKTVDFSTYASYSKQLLIVPKTANADISVMLKENVAIGDLAIDESIVVDWEMTANKLTSFGWEKDSLNVAYANTSAVGIGYTFGESKGATVLAADGTLSQSVSVNGTVTDGAVSWNDWNRSVRDSDNGVKLYGDAHIGYGGNYAINYTMPDQSTNTIGGYMLYKGASANGLTYGLRAEFNSYGYTSYARFVHNNDADKANPAWHRVSADYSNFSGAVRNQFNASNDMDISIECNDTGLSFYLDNISIKKVKSNAEQVTIKVDGKDFAALAGQDLPVAALVDNPAGFLLAVAKDSTNAETVLAITDTVTPAAGLEITLYTVELTASVAEMRTTAPYGIRWITEIDKESVAKLEELKTKGMIKDIEIGTLITPKSYADKAGDSTFAKLDTLASNYPYVLAMAEFGTWYATNDNSYSFAGSVVKLVDTHYSMDYVARGYLRLELEGGSEAVIYAPVDNAKSVANAETLAKAVVADTANGLSADVIAEIKKYIPA